MSVCQYVGIPVWSRAEASALWVWRLTTLQFYWFPELRVYWLSDLAVNICGLPALPIYWFADLLVKDLQGSRFAGIPGYWFTDLVMQICGSTGTKSVGLWTYSYAGIPVYWYTGIRYTSVLVYRYTSIPVCKLYRRRPQTRSGPWTAMRGHGNYCFASTTLGYSRQLWQKLRVISVTCLSQAFLGYS